MKRTGCLLLVVILLLAPLLASCAAGAAARPGGGLVVLAAEGFLADIAQNVAGSRLKVDAILPEGVDPHAFEPAPRDVAKIASADVLILNGAGLEEWLSAVIEIAGEASPRGQIVISASDGLAFREHQVGEPQEAGHGDHAGHPEGDPHFWLNPLNVIRYVENIRDGLTRADPAGREAYAANADAYIEKLRALDEWIQSEVAALPPARRVIVTNHESFGYYADRYGFTIAGSVLPSFSTDASPSARELAALIDAIKAAGVRVIFLEVGANRRLADQVAYDTGARVIADLHTHSLTGPEGNAPTYIEMMQYDTTLIVQALR